MKYPLLPFSERSLSLVEDGALVGVDVTIGEFKRPGDENVVEFQGLIVVIVVSMYK